MNWSDVAVFVPVLLAVAAAVATLAAQSGPAD
jgi:hypothetical protein